MLPVGGVEVAWGYPDSPRLMHRSVCVAATSQVNNGGGGFTGPAASRDLARLAALPH